MGGAFLSGGGADVACGGTVVEVSGVVSLGAFKGGGPPSSLGALASRGT